jgi:hypothetical protein
MATGSRDLSLREGPLCLLFFFFGSVGFEHRASHLLVRCSTTRAMLPDLFLL